jgi:1-acyl-sn-glycerol-3-phosphate acyltransferase
VQLVPSIPRALRAQRIVARVTAPLWLPALAFFMRLGMGWRIDGASALRERFRALRGANGGPLLVCPNHLTMVDSALVAWALAPPRFYLRDFAALPWNLPERRHFAAHWWSRAVVWLLKCVPIERGGSRAEVGDVLAKAGALLAAGEVVLVFPEGRRSRSGRIEVDANTWGVGRLVGAVPGCRVLCVYLRGRSQAAWSALPRRGERFRVDFELLEPKSDAIGVRRALDLSRQVLGSLAALEARSEAVG